jgi:hypothetical protein
MKQYKSPGLDGIINEFYQIYWDTIKEDLYEVLLEMLSVWIILFNTGFMRFAKSVDMIF